MYSIPTSSVAKRIYFLHARFSEDRQYLRRIPVLVSTAHREHGIGGGSVDSKNIRRPKAGDRPVQASDQEGGQNPAGARFPGNERSRVTMPCACGDALSGSNLD